MSIIEAIILGIVQGLTEFLPVSSSGHLELGKAIFGDRSVPSASLLFTVVVHAATALATLVVFRKEVMQILKGLARFERGDIDFTVKIVISMVPAAIIGLTMADEIEELFSQQVLLVGIMLLVTAVLLFFADRARRTDRDISHAHALVIGIAQAVAILPGISRSGATISTSVLLGIDRQRAASFSFLMVVPLILGKICKDILDGAITMQEDQFIALAIGFIASFVTGLLACAWMVKLVRRSQLSYFSYYCVVVGCGAILFHFFG